MKATPTRLPEVLILEPKVHGDERGYFYEAYNQATVAQLTGCDKTFIQDNQSRSVQGVLRGLHYQIGAHPQDKLVRVLSGAIYDVAVDIRRSSPRYGQWVGVELTAENKKQLWVPVGFAHGFLVTSATAEVLYKVSAAYDPQGERSIRWDDADIGIDWPLHGQPVLAAKDAAANSFADAQVFA